MLPRVVAVVDIGSNSVKVLVAKMQHGVIQELHIDAETTSLARALPQTGLMSQESILATLAALERFRSKILELGVSAVKVVGTAAMREARNATEVSKLVENIFSVPVEILSGLEEARLALQGALTARPDDSSEAECLFTDLGGASTEIGFLHPELSLVSTTLGALKTHSYLGLGGKAITDSKWRESADHIWSILEKEVPGSIRKASQNKKYLIAVGGTIVMATAALGLSAFRGSCYKFLRQDLENFADKLRKIDEMERSQIPKLRRDRADILPFGILVLTQIMKYLGHNAGISTVRGLRHGLAKLLLEKVPGKQS